MAKARAIKGIDWNGPATDGIRRVLIQRLDEMCSFRQAALDWKDPEGVHSMRVASRRLRSSLRDFMPYIRKRGLGSTLKQIRSIADALGEVRDQDVAIMALHNLASKATPEIANVLQDILESRKEIRRLARKQLEDRLAHDQLKLLSDDFSKVVDKATGTSDKQSALSYRRVARDVIRDRLQDLEKLSDGLYTPFESELLHEMRIAGKRLRYAIELFAEGWDPKILNIAKRAARLQSTLGQVHDCDIWIASFGTQIVKAKKAKHKEGVDAFTWILCHFIGTRTRQLQKCFTLWKLWDSNGTSNELRDLIKP
jgi:CHAD domain-containing protein